MNYPSIQEHIFETVFTLEIVYLVRNKYLQLLSGDIQLLDKAIFFIASDVRHGHFL